MGEKRKLSKQTKDELEENTGLVFLIVQKYNSGHSLGDVAQEILVEVMKRLCNFDSTKSSLKTFLDMSARFSSSTVKKKLLNSDGIKFVELSDIFSYEADLDSELIEIERSEILRLAIEKLPALERQIIFLSFFVGFPEKDIIKILGINAKTYSSGYSSALTLLRESLGELEL